MHRGDHAIFCPISSRNLNEPSPSPISLLIPLHSENTNLHFLLNSASVMVYHVPHASQAPEQDASFLVDNTAQLTPPPGPDNGSPHGSLSGVQDARNPPPNTQDKDTLHFRPGTTTSSIPTSQKSSAPFEIYRDPPEPVPSTSRAIPPRPVLEALPPPPVGSTALECLEHQYRHLIYLQETYQCWFYSVPARHRPSESKEDLDRINQSVESVGYQLLMHKYYSVYSAPLAPNNIFRDV